MMKNGRFFLIVIVVIWNLSQTIETLSFESENGYRSSCKFYLNGTVNLILSSPHGGSLMPIDLPDRSRGGCRRSTGPVANQCTWFHDDLCHDGQICSSTIVQDYLSDQFTENVIKFIWENYSLKVHFVVGQWSRKKVDFNREINEATFNHPETSKGYLSYHSNLQLMIDKINAQFGRGLLVDIHGHGGDNYTMIGYLLNEKQLNNDDLSSYRTSIDLMCSSSMLNKNECIRGGKSFGTILELNLMGKSSPSMNYPKPNDKNFFSGGFTTSHYADKINTIQTELPPSSRSGINKLLYAQRFAKSLIEFMKSNQLLLTSTSFSSIDDK